jgi:hypothetical protein
MNEPQLNNETRPNLNDLFWKDYIQPNLNLFLSPGNLDRHSIDRVHVYVSQPIRYRSTHHGSID